MTEARKPREVPEYKVLAQEIANLLFKKYPEEPTPEQFANIVGALDVVRKTMAEMAIERGYEIKVFDMEGIKQS